MSLESWKNSTLVNMSRLFVKRWNVALWFMEYETPDCHWDWGIYSVFHFSFRAIGETILLEFEFFFMCCQMYLSKRKIFLSLHHPLFDFVILDITKHFTKRIYSNDRK